MSDFPIEDVPDVSAEPVVEDEELSELIESDTSSGTVQARNSTDLVSVIASWAINLALPFINGMMLGFGEIFAHELGFRWGWAGARVVPRRNRLSPLATSSSEDNQPGRRPAREGADFETVE
uniref:ARAD1C09064p n=1 Tax=Blastobotrys adeninivorans TaxID=409370 RepID=A0A060T548_BLAAD